MLKNLFRKNLPLILSLLALLLTIPILLWGVSQQQEIRKKAAGPEDFPKVDLNRDGVVNNIDLQIYLQKFASPKP